MASKEAEKKAEEVRQELQRFTEERIKQNKLSIPLNSNLEAIIATALDEFAAAREKYRYDSAYKLEVVKREREKAKREAFARLEALAMNRGLNYDLLILCKEVSWQVRTMDEKNEYARLLAEAPTLQATVEQAEKEMWK